MEVQSIFGDVSVSKFVGEYLHRLPFSAAGVARGACELGTWDALRSLLPEAGNDVFAVRGGEWHEGEVPRDIEAARALVDASYTVFVRHAERHHAGLAELARAFEAAFLGAVNIHVFATPAGAPGFSWHYDAEDVFIIQTAGEKEYSLRKNTVNPWPLEETLPEDMRYEREQMPLMRVSLRAGDLLYIPCGYWHMAEARGMQQTPATGSVPFFSEQKDTSKGSVPFFSEQKKGTDPTAISLAVGVMSRSAMDVYDFLRKRLVQSLVWRQRLPLVGSAAALSRDELAATYAHLFKQLAADLAKTFADPRLAADFLAELANSTAGEQPSAGEEK